MREIKRLIFCLMPRIATILCITLFWWHSAYADAQQSAPVPGEREEAEILQAWHGDYPVDRLHLLPENQWESSAGYIADSETFAGIWQAFKPGEPLPEIDFENHLVFFARNTQFYNRISIGKIKMKEGTAELIAMETLSARPVEDNVAMSMVLVERGKINALRTGDTVLSVPE